VIQREEKGVESESMMRSNWSRERRLTMMKAVL